MDMITSASDEPGDHDTPSDIEVSGSSVGQLQNYASLGDLLNQVEALSLSIRRLEEENRLQGRELSSLMDVDDANARMVRLENDRFRRAIVTKDENITALQATADSLQRRWQKHVAGESSGSASMHLDIAVCPVQSHGHYDRYFPLRGTQSRPNERLWREGVKETEIIELQTRSTSTEADLERCIMNRDTWRIILNQLKEHHEQARVTLEQRRESLAKRLESAEARAQLRQEIINKIKKEISLVQKVLSAMGRSVQSLLVDGPEFTPADRDPGHPYSVDAPAPPHAADVHERLHLSISGQPSAPSCILGNRVSSSCGVKSNTGIELPSELLTTIADRGPSTFALEESDGSMKEPVKIKKNANKIAKQRNENTARNHCLRDWLEDHPRGTNGQFDAHWRSIRADANLLKPYQDRARKDVVAGKAKLNADKPAKLSQKNTARNHCMGDWLSEHPLGTNGQFDLHWARVREDAELLQMYRDRAKSS